MSMNKKAAEISMLLWILVVLVLSITTLYAFVSFKGNFNFHSEEISNVIEQANFNHQYVLAQANLLAEKTTDSCPSCFPDELKEKYKLLSQETENAFRFEGAGNFYAKIRNNDFKIEIKDNIPILIIENLFVKASQGGNKIKREFNIEIPLK